MAGLTDDQYMDEALQLAALGRGRTSPNPMVGALVVAADGEVVGRGYHEQAGRPHAEVLALSAAGDRARGATLYCTLEPCCHTGRTGPCVDRIVASGVRRVVVGVEDPNPLVAGGGIRQLRARGIEVRTDVRRHEAACLNEVFFTCMLRRRPFITMKVAASLDAKIAARRGVRTSLTSDAANRHAHRVRSEVDAIGIGSGTLLADDPLLTARLAPQVRPLTRVIFDRRLRTSPDARVLSTLDAGPVVILTNVRATESDRDRVAALRAAGATVEAMDDGDLRCAVRRLQEIGVTSLLLEGGATMHAAAWSAGLVDRVHLYLTPVTLGPEGVGWLTDRSFAVTSLRDLRVQACGVDVFIEGYVQRVD